MPILLWGLTAGAGLFFGAQALKQADQTAKNLTTLLIVGGVLYFFILNPQILKKFGRGK